MRWLTALALATAAGLASLLLGAPWAAALPAAVAGLAAGWLWAGPEPAAESAPSPLPAAPPVTPLIEAIDDPLLVVDGRRVAEANRAALAMLGAHIVGEDVRLAIRHPAAADRLAGRDANAAPLFVTGIGEPDRRWELSVHPFGPGERRLVRLADRSGAHAAERMRVDFVANASHELRTPLSTLLGFIETLEDANAVEDKTTRARFLKIMFGEAKRMQRLVDDLMSLSRIEAERYSPPQTRVDLAALVEEVRDATLTGQGEDGARVLVTLEDDAPLVAGDRAQLGQLLHNLIGNALKYGRAGAPVTVTVAPAPGAMLRLGVADEGEGIAEEHLPRLTERFYRVDPGRSRALGGTGLGLAIVKHIVERHRGRLDIRSVAGRGTTVTVLLPAAPAEG